MFTKFTENRTYGDDNGGMYCNAKDATKKILDLDLWPSVKVR